MPDINIIKNVPLASFCTLGTGGTAEIFAEPESVPQLQKLVRAVKNCPVYILGGGSNIIFSDGVINGLTISTKKLNSIKWHDEFTAQIQAGFMLPSLLKTLKSQNLGGLEFAAGIPGTLGGAIFGNAGAGGHGVCEFIENVDVMNAEGDIKTYAKNEIHYAYRKSSFAEKSLMIISAVMKFRKAKPEDEDTYKNFMLRRKNQPYKFRSAGCTFKNPEGYSAGKLLDECGCKGLNVGGAAVSEMHANFILNLNNASSSDVIALINICAEKVYNSTGIKLEPEIKTASPCFYV